MAYIFLRMIPGCEIFINNISLIFLAIFLRMIPDREIFVSYTNRTNVYY